MTTPHHSEPAREAVALPSEITEAQVNSACLSYRHDFGLLDEHDKERQRFVAKEWLHAWRKEFDPLAPALKVSASPAPAASGGLEAVREALKAEPQLADGGFGPERSIEFIVRWFYRHHLTDKAKADVVADRYLSAIAALAAPAATGGEAVGEIVMFEGVGKEVSWREGKMPPAGSKLYTHPAPSETGASLGVKEAVTLALEWDERRNYIMPYKVRDKLRAALEGRSDG